MDDVIIIGGSFAGLASAMTLGRARRRVTVLDTGLPRNRYASHAHNVFGHDGKPPRQILDEVREQLRRYDTVRLLDAKGEAISGAADAFTVSTSAGAIEGRRVILSYGVSDLFPAIPGFAECWGKTVIHCPYCHGFEVAGQRWGVVYSSPMSLHAPTLYADWTDDITLFTDGHDIPEAERSKLATRNVRIVDGKVEDFQHQAGKLSAVVVSGTGPITMDAVYAHPRVCPSADLHRDLGVEMVETPFGEAIKIDEGYQTSVPGIFAAGDLVSPMHSVVIANHGGMLAAVNAQRSMLQ